MKNVEKKRTTENSGEKGKSWKMYDNYTKLSKGEFFFLSFFHSLNNDAFLFSVYFSCYLNRLKHDKKFFSIIHYYSYFFLIFFYFYIFRPSITSLLILLSPSAQHSYKILKYLKSREKMKKKLRNWHEKKILLESGVVRVKARKTEY